MTPRLREGFTTGSAAAGAALAAWQLVSCGQAPDRVRVPLPPLVAAVPRGWLELEVALTAPGPAPELAEAWRRQDGSADAPPPHAGHSAHAVIIKDGGDDPDATNGARITATVVMNDSTASTAAHAPPLPHAPTLRIAGGPGVGRVTLPGLPVPVGKAAINPVPQAQLRATLQQGQPLPPLTVYLSVPDGEALARHTLNPRLGIVGGISILGTHGIVRPFSHAAWKATIEQGLSVARATGCQAVGCSTGRRSETLLMAQCPTLPPQAFVQVGDYAAFTLKAAERMGFREVIWGCFFGKLLKLAQGCGYTHARDTTLDLRTLAGFARRSGLCCADAVAVCTTAAQALEFLLAEPGGQRVLAQMAAQALEVMRTMTACRIQLHLFHMDGRLLLVL